MSLDQYTKKNYEIPTTILDKFKGYKEKGLVNQYEIYVSNISICLFVALSEMAEFSIGLADFIRDQILDIGDYYKFKGFKLPSVLILKVEDKNLEDWRKQSGDQEWLRADFSIQVISENEDEKVRLELLVSDSLFSIAEFQPLSDETLIRKLNEKITTIEENPKKREALNEIAESLSQKSPINHLDKWLKNLEDDFKKLKG
ncbi:hypothetical protein [Leptospira meyeri]|uniref:hypothetical protein n=1 Tax=Leptospira meyeri TaxID=29508 RepID=UPI000C29D5BE|nr:hypothetical protein [Leptospira meyeri]PJZ79871.1 hypothetical protein CH359_15165 [Leptospira meyeri]PJZ96169.1 hypothetical protein CH358_14745 [Leptospira meyeri]